MSFLLITMGVYDFDGRLRSLYELFSKVGNCELISFAANNHFLKSSSSSSLSFYNYFKMFSFIIFSFFTTIRKSDYIVIDNYYTSVFGVLIKYTLNKKIIYDMRELYCEKPSNYRLFTRVLIWAERLLIGKSDIVLVANQERKNYLIKNYKNITNVVVFENVRFLPCNESSYSIDKKLLELISSYECCVVSTGGYSESRGTGVLINSFTQLPDSFGLFIVGGGESEFLENHDCRPSNVHFLPKVPYEFLSNILLLMDIGVVHYSFDDVNNRLCASGKVYEYIALGLPVVTTEHKSLIRFCMDSNAGIADNSYFKAIKLIYDDLEEYSVNAKAYSAKSEIVDYDSIIANEIKALVEGQS